MVAVHTRDMGYLASRLGMGICAAKTEGPAQSMEYLWLTLKHVPLRYLCDEERAGAPAPGADCPADALVCREPRPAAGVPGSFYLSSARIILIINPRVCVCVWYTLSSDLQI